MTYTTTNLREAACIITTLGLPFEVISNERVIGDSVEGKRLDQIIIKDETKGSAKLRGLTNAWRDGTLDSMHPMRIKWRACQNFDVIRDAIYNQRSVRVASYAGGKLFQVIDGDEPLKLTAAPEVRTSDFNLACALSVIGIPIIGIEQAERKFFQLPATGHPRLTDAGWISEQTAALIKRAGRRDKPFDLALEDSNPAHPLCQAYDVLHAYAHIRKSVKNKRANLVLSFPESTARKAIISSNASGRVLDIVQRHLGLPEQ